ncbi:MAG TPA: hypothetical protein VF304_00090 [Casimicrobiaceae bacterium]
MHFDMNRKWRRNALSAAVSTVLALGAANVLAISQSGEAQNMIRIGHTDLQGRPTYQPNLIQYPDGRWMLFVGQHSGVPEGRVTNCPSNTLPDPLNGGACENNGTMIIDVTDPRNPVELKLIPAPSGGQAQMVRMCLGSVLPGGITGHVYLLRNVQGGSQAGYQMFDVTDPKNPVMKKSLTGIRSTHKDWIECSTGIAYMPGSKNSVTVPGTPLWRQSQAMLIYDWSNPENGQPPVYIRTFGLPGGEPNATGTVPNSLHGAISAHDHPMAAQKLARGQDVIGNRIYAAWGVGNDGIVTIINRDKLLPLISDGHGGNKGGSWMPETPNSFDAPQDDELIGPKSPTVGYFQMSPDQGGHTSMPVFGLKPRSMQSYFDPSSDDAKNDGHFNVRDIVVVTSEATADGGNGFCQEPPHFAFTLDVTVENSMTSPPSTRVEHDPYQGPMVLGTMSVDPRSGAKYKRGNYCTRGARFGVHSTEENFNNPYYGKLTALAYFNGGLRVWDIREPQAPREVAFYVPQADALTDTAGYMTNNVEIDNRGYFYVVDRDGAGMDVLQLTGCPSHVVDKGTVCPDLGNNNAGGNGHGNNGDDDNQGGD